MAISGELFHLAGAGEEYCTAEYFHDAARRKERPHLVIQMTLSGCGFYERKKHRTLLPAGHAFVDEIPGPFSYGYASHPQLPARTTYHQLFISLTGRPARQWMKHLHTTAGPTVDLSAALPEATALLRQLIATARGAPQAADEYAISALAYQLLMLILSSQQRARLATHPRVLKALELIASHSPDPTFSVLRLAGLLDCSREYVSRAFRAATGSTPAEQILRHRLQAAATQLRTTDDKLQLVASRCGFSSANYLCRVFKRTSGVTPAQYRQRPWLGLP